ncbi:asparagine synthase (glutamine-hydrolyzing) [uncultured Roseivirga sp.]|uniref:asparagine synthase (glutamine-hydrolyzing) n=1 Tax=uncultured Roseivirga sp. TaxID=543088 RepID=UPI0030DD3CAA
MCGILGSFSKNTFSEVEKNLKIGIDELRHRGPNDTGKEFFELSEGVLALGHTRLSIIDLTEGGHQPMASSDGRFVIVFNGEIYNYKELREELILSNHVFVSNSDTEVLIASWRQWGEQCLNRLKGMFSFVLFDRDLEHLICSRDAFGIKPFFYSLKDSEFFFGSEVRALNKLISTKPKVNQQMVFDYLAFGGYDNSENTFFENIHHLLPGYLMRLSFGKKLQVEKLRWWKPTIGENRNLSFDQAAGKLREMFLDSVRLHLRSDVPVGAALSGGLDSSAVVCAMRYLEPNMPIHTFTYVAEDSKINEEKWADVVNDHVGAIPHKISLGSSDLWSDLDDMICSQGEPFVGTSIYAQYSIFRSARENGVVVTLDGQGADEMLAGYSGYPEFRYRSLWQKARFFQAVSFILAWLTWPNRDKNEAKRIFIKSFVPSFLKKRMNDFNIKRSIPGWIKKDIVKKSDLSLSSRLVRVGFQDENTKGRILVDALREALTGNGLASLLRHADRNSMHWSIESRVPFLTTELAEFLLSLPESYLISQEGETKSIFRVAMRGIVPDAVLDRKDKIGFETPELDLLRTQHTQITEWMEILKVIPYIDYPKLIKEVEDVLKGNRSYHSGIWRIVNVSRWLSLNSEMDMD